MILDPPVTASDPIVLLDLNVRAYNIVKNMGVQIIGELFLYSERDLLREKNCGPRSIGVIRLAMWNAGFLWPWGSEEIDAR
jgi:DNA-directed RNA polymerase alpha subunit